MSKLVYLAGPIGGLSYSGANNWREYAIERLEPIKGLSPMRDKEFLSEINVLGFHGYDQNPLSTSAAITARDRFDCQRADVVIFNLLGAERVSIGTMIEFGWADSKRIPKIVIMEKDGSNVHDHCMVNALIDFRVETLNEAIAVAKSLLCDALRSNYD